MAKSIMDVYKDVLKNAQYFKDEASRNLGVGDTLLANKQMDISHELYKVAADLERTEEINPTT